MSGHLPVLLNEVVTLLAPKDGEHYVDGTFGGGGYARAILEAADCRVLGIDRDPDAIARRRAAHPTASCSISASRRSSSTSLNAVSRFAPQARSTCA